MILANNMLCASVWKENSSMVLSAIVSHSSTQDMLMAKQEAFLNLSVVLLLPVGHIFMYTCLCLRKKYLSALLNSLQFNKLTWSHKCKNNIYPFSSHSLFIWGPFCIGLPCAVHAKVCKTHSSPIIVFGMSLYNMQWYQAGQPEYPDCHSCLVYLYLSIVLCY